MAADTQHNEVLAALSRLATDVSGRFDLVDERFAVVDDGLASLRKDVTALRSSCVTKGYLDQQLLDVRADLGTLVRKADLKVNALVDVLHCRQALTDADRTELLAMGPFPARA
jgi:hypothetical protein